MAHVLFAWELGDGLGHVSRMLPLADALAAAAHRCSFAVRDIRLAGPPLRDAGYAYLPAPCYPPDPARRSIRGLTDILALVGYADPGQLETLVVAWRNLFAASGADLVVADYAPTACLAAAGALPVVEIGDPFTSPPSNGRQFLNLDGSWDDTDNAALVLRHVQTVQRRLASAVSDSLRHALRPHRHFLVTLPELCRPAPASVAREIVGPLAPLPRPDTRPTRNGYFAYLAADAKGVRGALSGLASSGVAGEIYLRNAPPDLLAEASRMRLTVHTKPRHLPDAAAKARFLIHHGGLGTAEIGLAIGRPQLLIPRHQEQAANALRLRRLGCAVAMRAGGRYAAADIGRALAHLADPKFERAASSVAATIAARGGGGGLDQVRDACLALLPSQALAKP